MTGGGIAMTRLRIPRRVAARLALLTIPLWLAPLAWQLSYQSSAILSGVGRLLLAFVMVAGFFALAALAIIVASPVMILFRKYRIDVARAFAQAVVFLLSFVGGFSLGLIVWRKCVNELIDHGEPLVFAIHEFAAQHGRPPESLEELVPQYIAAIPLTGNGSFPKFRYVVGEPAAYDGNPWVIIAIPPSLPMGFDQVMYFPLQNYPKVGYGGGLERFGRWAYVHE